MRRCDPYGVGALVTDSRPRVRPPRPGANGRHPSGMNSSILSFKERPNEPNAAFCDRLAAVACAPLVAQRFRRRSRQGVEIAGGCRGQQAGATARRVGRPGRDPCRVAGLCCRLQQARCQGHRRALDRRRRLHRRIRPHVLRPRRDREGLRRLLRRQPQSADPRCHRQPAAVERRGGDRRRPRDGRSAAGRRCRPSASTRRSMSRSTASG